jgi:hypothetical protein
LLWRWVGAVLMVSVLRPFLLGGTVRSLLSLSLFIVSFLFFCTSLKRPFSLSLELSSFFLLAVVFDCCFGVAGPSCPVFGGSFQGGHDGGFQVLLAKGVCTFRVVLPFLPTSTSSSHLLLLLPAFS